MKSKTMKFCITIAVGFALFIAFFLPAGFCQGRDISSAEIIRQVQSELLLTNAVASHLLDVEIHNGIVTLSGTVDNILSKERAARVAESVKGVRSVVNKIEVKPVVRSDEDIRKDVEKALLYDPATQSYDVAPRVSGGNVTLTGTVNSWAEKELAGKVAKGVKGVKKVDNIITVSYEEDRPDHEIKNEIERKLEWDIYVNEGLIDVNVDGGKVTLSGSVGSATEKRQAYMDAWIVGVKSVTSDGLEVIPVFADEMLRKDKTVIKTDAEIKKAVKDALLYDPRVFSFNVDVEVDNRIVTLKGKVNNLKAKRLAEQDAMNTAGVFNVRNLIKVRLLEAPADEIIAGNVRSAIEWDPFLERHEITVIVRNKKAYIYGVVDSYFEKEHAEDVASRVFGVADVQNNITVGYVWPFKSDAKIKNDVEGQLFWSLLVDSDDIDIEVNNGVVTLTGKVNNWSELDAAVRNAFEGGAWRVKSEMEIEGQEVTYPATYYYYSYNNEWIS